MDFNLKTVSLKDLLGEHWLDAVSFSTQVKTYSYTTNTSDCNVMRFRLDNVGYTVIEDPDDGYRSSMEEIFISDEPFPQPFIPQWVIGRWRDREPIADEEPDVVELIDVWTGKVIIEVGTSHSDEYYPSFVAVFHPENMVINQGVDNDEL